VRKATKTDKKLVIDIIAESFDKNPSVNWVIKNDTKRKKRIKELSKYSFETALMRNGAFISSDENGVALCYKYNEKGNLLADYWNQAKLAIKAVGLSRVIEVSRRESYIKKMRPNSGKYLYFWFLGVNNKGVGKGAAYEIKNFIFNKSKDEKLAIYLETSVEKNKLIYERFGFKTYHTWEDKSKNFELWFMKREPTE